LRTEETNVSTLASRLDRIGPARFALVLVLLPVSLFYLAAGLYVTSGLDPLGIHDKTTHISGDDFVTFWAAAHFALDGIPTWAYDPVKMHAAEIAVTGPLTKFTPWHYPPTFMLAVIPLGLVPFHLALYFWLLIPLVALSWLAQELFRTPTFSWALPMFPSAVLCLVSGQNGFLTALLIGAMLFHLERRQFIAGVLCGLLTWKPHLAALLFVVLAAGGYWRALASAAATALVLVAASVAVLGLAPWYAFFGNLAYVTQLLDTGGLPWARMPSVYVSARLAGLDIAAARIIQVIVAAAALAAVCAIWYRGASLAWRGAALIAALPLVTPYVFDYDLVALYFAMAWLLGACLKDGWQPGDTAVLLAAWIGPALSWPLIKLGGPPFMPVVFAAFLAVVWRRAFPLGMPARVPQPRTV
jgi:Glycosyltransferase family 87